MLSILFNGLAELRHCGKSGRQDFSGHPPCHLQKRAFETQDRGPEKGTVPLILLLRLVLTSPHRDQIPATGDILGPVAVHQALCHPTILSLFSTFPAVDSDGEDDQPQTQSGAPGTAMMRYIVLEHCGPYGTLFDHLPRLNLAPSSPLEESRIRGVAKTLADALTYLEKENVVHRRLIPESVYVTEDFRVVSVKLWL